jgi:hypothetical protein
MESAPTKSETRLASSDGDRVSIGHQPCGVTNDPGTPPGGSYGSGYPSSAQPQYGQPAYQVPQPQQPYPPQPYPQQGYPQPGYPQPGYPPQAFAPPPKKSKAPLIIGIILGAVVLICGGAIAVVALAANAEPTETFGTTDPGSKVDPAESEAAAVGLNKPVRDGKFEFTVKSVTCGKTVEGDEFLSKKAQGQFCEVKLTVKNIGDKPQYFDGSSQKAKGTTGVEYGNDGVAEIYANQDNETFLNEINPGNQTQGILIFDIPKGAKIASLELHDSAFSGGVTVKVG